MKNKIENFMVGRYGMDNLNKFLIGLAGVCLVFNMFFRINFSYYLGLVPLVFCYIRMLSKNIGKRTQENQKYLAFQYLLNEKWGKYKIRLKQFRGFHIYKCPQCNQKIRIPRKKGRISIHCPKCGMDFIKRS